MKRILDYCREKLFDFFDYSYEDEEDYIEDDDMYDAIDAFIENMDSIPLNTILMILAVAAIILLVCR